jgi:hypothetical protein
MKAWGINVVAGGTWWIPKTNKFCGVGLLFCWPYTPSRINSITAKGGIVFTGALGGQYVMDTNGCFIDTASTALLKAHGGAVAVPDGETGAKLLKAFASTYRDGPFVFERLAVDRATEKAYWNGNYYIADWNNPVIRQLPVSLDNITIGPNGFMYGWNIEGQSTYGEAFIKRYNGSTYAAAPYGNTGSNRATGQIHYQFGFAGTPGNHRGIAVGWQGQIAAFSSGNIKALLSVTGYTGGKTPEWTWTLGRMIMNGVKYDPAGNYYVGVKKIPPGPVFLDGMGMDLAFRESGSVVKFNRDAVGTMNQTVTTFTGYEKIYPHTFGPFAALSTGGTLPGTNLTIQCTCRNSYFDVDPFGRLYIPNGVSCRIYVVDNAGNTICTFGQYGNTDSRGGLSGPGQVLAKPDIPLAWPTTVAASEDYVYIADAINARLARVRMVYTIDNFPDLTAHISGPGKNVAWKKTALSAAPNPFNPESRITVRLHKALRLDLRVYDVGGRLVRAIASGEFPAGVRQFTWDAKDGSGRTVSPGVYLYRLAAGGRVLTYRTVLAR